MDKGYPTIDLVATGQNIRRLREKRGLTVRQVQEFCGFSMPQAVYKWERGENLPSIDNLYALSRLFGVTIEEILVQR